MRMLGVDPGDKRLGIALSDPSGTIAAPLKVLIHISRKKDAQKIASLAEEYLVGRIVVGQALNENGQPSFEGRRSARLAAAIRNHTDIPVVLWDESDSTKIARSTMIKIGASRRKRRGHLDDIAATIILQSYLDSLAANKGA